MKKRTLVHALFLAISASCFAAAKPLPATDMPEEFRGNLQDAIERAKEATTAKYPDADIATVCDHIHTVYNKDATETTWDDEYTIALTEKGRKSLSTFTLHFTERYGDAKILAVELIGKDGSVRKIDFEKTTKTVTDNDSMSANIYDPLDKKLVCTIPGMKTGDIRRVRFCRRTLKARMKDTWSDYNVFEYSMPILSTTLTISQPDDNPVKHAVLRNAYSNTVVRSPDRPFGKGRKLLRWDVRNVPQAFAEPNMPPFYTQMQKLVLSTAKDWESVSRWYWNLCLPRLAASNEAMTNKVDEITSKEKTRGGKIRGLFRFVSQEIRYMGLTDETEAPGYEPHDVKLTFDNRYGVCRDKAALLVEMLRIAGIKAYPVLIHAGAKMDEEVPLPYFNHAIVGVECEGKEIEEYGKYMLMDPTNESTRDLFPAYLSDKSYLVARPDGEKLLTSQVVKVEKNMYKVDSKGTLSPDGSIVLESNMSFGGINDTAYRAAFRKRTDRERRAMFQRWMERVSPGAELLSLRITPENLADTEKPLEASLSVRFPQVTLKGEKQTEIPLPFITKAIGIADMLLDENTSLESRRFPLVLSTTAGWEETLSISCGEELGKVKRIPDDVKIGSGKEGYVFSRTISATNNTIVAKRSLLVSDVNFDSDEYLKLRENRKRAESGERSNPVFANIEDDNANTKIISTKRIVHFRSPKNWVATNIVEKEILTYRGKKTASELRFDFNPVVRNYEIVEASVSNRNGTVKTTRKNEINVMDAAWAGSAPRYPASKIMMVNLPAVEIGSVIRTTVAETVTNSPVPFSESNAFGATSPVGLEEVEFHVPAGMRFAVKGKPTKTIDKTDGGKCYKWSVKNPKRIPDEPSQPGVATWRKSYTVSAADWNETGMELISALDEAAEKKSSRAKETAKELTSSLDTPEAKIEAIRKYISEKIKSAGPGIFSLPFELAFFAPDRVLAEGYASTGDRYNLFRTMLEGAGFETTILMAGSDSLEAPAAESKRREMPRPASFANPVIKAVYGARTFWIAGENEYTPVMASSKFNDSYYNPLTDTFGKIGEKTDHSSWLLPWTWFAGSDCALESDGGKWLPNSEKTRRLSVRENGTVDFDVTNRYWGASVGALRKTYDEMLPENRSRHFQAMLGNLSANATATRELETDTTGYPFVQSYSACVADYAVAKGDEITLSLPAFTDSLFAVGGMPRKSPIKIAGNSPSSVSYEVVFPKGFTKIEFMPEAFTLRDPSDNKTIWIEQTVKTNIVDGVLRLTVKREAKKKRAKTFSADYAPFFREWNRKASAPQTRTVTVGK